MDRGVRGVRWWPPIRRAENSVEVQKATAAERRRKGAPRAGGRRGQRAGTTSADGWGQVARYDGDATVAPVAFPAIAVRIADFPPRLLELVREAIRTRRYSPRTR